MNQFSVWKLSAGKSVITPITGDPVTLEEACQLLELMEKGRTLIGLPEVCYFDQDRQDGYLVMVGANVHTMYLICTDQYDTTLLHIASSIETSTRQWR